MIIQKKLFSYKMKVQKLRSFSIMLSTSTTRFCVPKEVKIRLGNYNINYAKVGTGPHNVLCMPGILGSMTIDFKPQMEGFNRERFTLVTWDPPGYGKSRPPERNFLTGYYEDADTAFQLMKALNITKFSVLGWSYGAMSSFILAAKHPEAVRKMAVWGARAFIQHNEIMFYNKTKDISLWPEKLRKPLVDHYGEETFSALWEQWVESLMVFYNSNEGDLCSEFLEKIKCPTLILYGAKDPLVHKIHASHLHAHIQGSRLCLYPEGGHKLQTIYPEDFNRTVQRFLLQD